MSVRTSQSEWSGLCDGVPAFPDAVTHDDRSATLRREGEENLRDG